jgi:hypothetical protein
MLGSKVLQYWTEEFYSCKSHSGEVCQNAVSVGKQVFEAIKNKLSEDIAQEYFVINYGLARAPGQHSFSMSLQPSVQAYKTPFPAFLYMKSQSG